MTLDELDAVLDALGPTERPSRSRRLTVGDRSITCLADDEGDALRLVCPVAELSEMSESEKDRLLEASFHASLVAHFAAFEGVVVAVWAGRLSALEPTDLADAVAEVVALASCVDVADR